MSTTTFTFTGTKSVNKDTQYAVNLGNNILEVKTDAIKDVSELAIRKMAEDSAVVKLCNYKASLLRHSNSAEDAETFLQTLGYTSATVEVYTPLTTAKPVSVEDILNAVKNGKLDKEIAKAQMKEALAKLS